MNFVVATTAVLCLWLSLLATRATAFSSVATVLVKDQGPVAMTDLEIGAEVLTGNGYQTLYALAHNNASATTKFLQIHTQGYPHPLETTAQHMLYVLGRELKTAAVPAHSIRRGDVLKSNHWPQAARVTKITTIYRKGIYAPLTTDGTIVVNGIVSSCYVAFQQEADDLVVLRGGRPINLSQHLLVHVALTPVRMACLGLSSELCQWYDENGLAYFAKMGLALQRFAESQCLPVQVLFLAVCLQVFLFLYLLECIYGPQLACCLFLGLALGLCMPVRCVGVLGRTRRLLDRRASIDSLRRQRRDWLPCCYEV